MSGAYADIKEDGLVSWLLIKVYSLIFYTWAILIFIAMFRWSWGPGTVILMVVGLMIYQFGGCHVINYGFHRRTEEEKWDEFYEESLDTRDKFNRRATIFWMLGMKDRALRAIEEADYAWLDAQLVLANEDNPVNHERS